MAKSTLFGYSIEEEDGKLVVTVDGLFAAEALRALRENVSQGRGYSVLSWLFPVHRLSRLMSASVGIAQTGKHYQGEQGTPSQRLDLESIFSQGIDQDLGAFEQQMQQFRTALIDMSQTAAEPAAAAKRKTASSRADSGKQKVRASRKAVSNSRVAKP